MNPTIKICPFTEGSKKNKHPEELRSDFLTHCSEHHTIPIYTDGSKTENRVGYATKFPNNTFSGRLPGEASIFTAELYAIKTAITESIGSPQLRGDFTIYCDSQSAILALGPSTRPSPIVMEIQSLLKQAEETGSFFDFCWVPGHTGVEGNDAAAKLAASDEEQDPSIHPIPHTDLKRPIREAISTAWQHRWNNLGQEGRKLREIKGDIKEWKSSIYKNRRFETALTRLRIGHTNFSHSYLMEGRNIPPNCEQCNQPISVKHILVECRKYSRIRNKYYHNANLSEMLGNANNFSAYKLYLFLQETDILSKI